MREVVPIDEVEFDASIGILVRPKIPVAEHYEHIYRTASGVRWQPQKRALVPYEVKGMSPAWWFRQIVAAVQSEYGQRLELRPDTRRTNVPEPDRREIESEHRV
jgi:hypothetical protein